MQGVRRIYVEKKPGFDHEATSFYLDLKENLGLETLTGVRIINRYDMEGLSDEEYAQARTTIFSEPTVDFVYDEKLELRPEDRVFAMEYLPGQYDQRADSAAQCVQILTQKERPVILSAKVVVLEGPLTDEEFKTVKHYYINPVESREASLDKPANLEMTAQVPDDVEIIQGFTELTSSQLEKFLAERGLAMSLADLAMCQEYFRNTEHRNPTLTEIKTIDTYWSDHCRHTTFLTNIDGVEIAEGRYTQPVQEAYQLYSQARQEVYGTEERPVCLMDIAVMGMKQLRNQGKLPDLDQSEEINACSIVVDVDIDGHQEPWLVMFKNETHNHPTEIEPFGGAATCLGGSIRDPLSGRSYVYQAMRVTGSADPRTPISETISGKLPQRTITTGAASGYSSYGNQIGLATGQVAEVYHPDFVAKRMEIGAVIAAAPKANVVRERPLEDDIVILLGGRTGRDGCGGATGSSKEHTEESILTSGSEVQKGNPPTERKIQRLFRHPEVATMIKRCNDFGAGGVSVAIGELTEGLVIDLDAVPKKYEGLDGTELAISESQERMAVVVAPEDADKMIEFARKENLEATKVAVVTGDRRLKMQWRGQNIVDISRDFLDTNGAAQHTRVSVTAPEEGADFFSTPLPEVAAKLPDVAEAWLANLADLNVCSQKGLVERFDSTIGAGSVLMPFGGKNQLTPTEGMVAKIPLLQGETTTGTIMTYGYNPRLAKWSPFHGALYAVVEAAAKVVALGGDYSTIRLTLQEYFEKLSTDNTRWGKPFSALLGAFYAQSKLGIPAIGGKDSMSGTFKDLNVPPTLVAFAVAVTDVSKTVSAEFKQAGSQVVMVPVQRDDQAMPDFSGLTAGFAKITELIGQGRVMAAQAVRGGGVAEALSKMAFGNSLGFQVDDNIAVQQLFTPEYGAIVLELAPDFNVALEFGQVPVVALGHTLSEQVIRVAGAEIPLNRAAETWLKPLNKIFPVKGHFSDEVKPVTSAYDKRNSHRPSVKIAKPRILIPVFPGTNCEYDTARAFEQAGGVVDTMVIRNLTSREIEESMADLARRIDNSQIIMIPGGFSGGDEPDGSGKFIATAFRNPRVKEAVMNLLKNRDGLMLGICNGFQALIKLGLVPYGEIRDITDDDPTLTFNTVNRHVSCMVSTRVASVLSPWFNGVQVGDMHSVPVSHGEGRFVASEEVVQALLQKGQVATQYVDLQSNPTYDSAFNPNGSVQAIEGITSPDGRVLGKMAHSERTGLHVASNVPGHKDQLIFRSGVEYFL